MKQKITAIAVLYVIGILLTVSVPDAYAAFGAQGDTETKIFLRDEIPFGAFNAHTRGRIEADIYKDMYENDDSVIAPNGTFNTAVRAQVRADMFDEDENEDDDSEDRDKDRDRIKKDETHKERGSSTTSAKEWNDNRKNGGMINLQAVLEFLRKLQDQIATLFARVNVLARAPTLSSLKISDTSSSSVIIAWKTDEPATGAVYYTASSSLDILTASSTSNATLVTDHTVSLSGLTASTTYLFIVESKDENGNTTKSSQRTFITASQ